MTIIEKVLLLMQNDDEDRERQSEILQQTYETASASEKKAIDNCFIALCGFALGTILENPAAVESYL